VQVLAGAAHREFKRGVPRLAMVIEGSSGRHMAQSAESRKSAASFGGMGLHERAEIDAAALLLASMMKRMLTGSLPSVRMKASATDDRISMGGGPCRQRRRAHRGGRRAPSARRRALPFVERAGRLHS